MGSCVEWVMVNGTNGQTISVSTWCVMRHNNASPKDERKFGKAFFLFRDYSIYSS